MALSPEKQKLLSLVYPNIPESLPNQAIREKVSRRITLLSDESVSSMIAHAEELNETQLVVVHDVVHHCMAVLSSPASYSARELEIKIRYALSGARILTVFGHPEFHAMTLMYLRDHCERIGYEDSADLLEPDSEHAEVLNGLIIEDAIVNYAFEDPMYFRFLGEHADALIPHAKILTGDAPAGQHRVDLDRIDNLIRGGTPVLLEGVL